MFEFVWVCGAVCVHGPEKGESVLVLMGQMCCLLHLYLLPWASIIYDLGVWAWSTMEPSMYDVWSSGLRNRTSCPGTRLYRGQALYLLPQQAFCRVFLVIR